MSGQTGYGERPPDWMTWAGEVNEQVASAVAASVDGQMRFTEAWLDSIDRVTGQRELDEGLDGLFEAYEVWMGAAHDSFELVNDSLEGEDVPVERFRDAWLNAANQAFKSVLGTAAFSAATGGSIDDLLDLRTQADELAAATLRDVGLPTHGDVEEVGERLVELERRQHAVEEKLDEVVEALEAEA